jgi:non-specific serine/threonine protein kinase
VCDGVVLETLTDLVDKSLVFFEGRYRMLETVRQYAREKLAESGEEPVFRARHLDYFVEFSEEAAPHIFGGESDKAWLRRVEDEYDNVRAAFEWAEADSENAEAALRLIAAVHWFWFARSHVTEGRERVQAALLRRASAPKAARGRALAAAGFTAMWAGDFGAMHEPLAEALELAERLGDDWLRCYSLCGLGAAALFTGDPSMARTWLERAEAVARGSDHEPLLVFSLYWLGSAREVLVDFSGARRALGEALELARERDMKPGIAHILHRLAHCAHTQGQYAEAHEHYVGSLDALAETGDLWGFSQSLDALGRLAGAEGDQERAAVLLGAADALRRRVGAEIFPSEREDHERAMRTARETRGERAFSEAWAKGRALSPDEALEFARAFSQAGDLGATSE